MQCTKCGSENTQRLQVVFDGGTHNIDTKSNSVSGGVVGGFMGGAVSSTSTSGTSQSTLAAKAAPPQRQSLNTGVAIIVVAFFFMSTSSPSPYIGYALLAGGAYLVRNAYKFNKAEWPMLRQHWENSWLCHRCGNSYVFAT